MLHREGSSYSHISWSSLATLNNKLGWWDVRSDSEWGNSWRGGIGNAGSLPRCCLLPCQCVKASVVSGRAPEPAHHVSLWSSGRSQRHVWTMFKWPILLAGAVSSCKAQRSEQHACTRQRLIFLGKHPSAGPAVHCFTMGSVSWTLLMSACLGGCYVMTYNGRLKCKLRPHGLQRYIPSLTYSLRERELTRCPI